MAWLDALDYIALEAAARDRVGDLRAASERPIIEPDSGPDREPLAVCRTIPALRSAVMRSMVCGPDLTEHRNSGAL
jgi:hypothetical protein